MPSNSGPTPPTHTHHHHHHHYHHHHYFQFSPLVQNEIALTRMQSIRRSFRHSLKRFNVSRSMRNGQSTQRSVRSNKFVRAGSIRVSNRVTAKAPLAAAEPLPPPQPEPTPASAEMVPMALRRDSVRTISFMAPCHLGGEWGKPLCVCS